MRFLYLGPFRFPNGDAAASRVLNNARLIRDLGYNIRILSFGGKLLSENKISNKYFYDGIEYFVTNDIDNHTWKERISRYTFPNPNAWNFLKIYKDTFDVLIVYNTTLMFNIRLLSFCQKYNKKIILDLTEWPASNESIGGKYSPLFWLSEFNMKYIQLLISNKILISRFLSNFYKKGNNIILPPLIYTKDSKWNNIIPINNVQITKHKGIKIIFAGTPAKKDLLGNLIKALFSVLNNGYNIQLIIAGVSNEQSISYIDNKKDFEKFKDNIIFLGKIPQEYIPSYYYISDFSAIIRVPSRKNMAGFPTKMAESMAAGRPVLMNLTSDLEEYAQDGKNAIIINDYKVDSIIQGLNRIMALTNDQLSEMKEYSKKIGHNKFDYRNYINNMKLFLSHLK